MMNDFHESKSNLPYTDDANEDLCPQFNGTYEINNYMITRDLIPPTLEKGMYKGTVLIYDGDITASAAEVYIKLYWFFFFFTVYKNIYLRI